MYVVSAFPSKEPRDRQADYASPAKAGHYIELKKALAFVEAALNERVGLTLHVDELIQLALDALDAGKADVHLRFEAGLDAQARPWLASIGD